MKNAPKSTWSLSAAVAAVFALAPAAQADTVVLTSSTQLNLTGPVVLAAVNFYDPGRIAEGQRTTGVIQGVDFDDFRTNVDDTGSPIALSAGAAGATLSTVINQSPGREYNNDPANMVLAGADLTEAKNLVNAGMYFQDSETATLTFAFGASYADTEVEVQMTGAGQWNRNGDRVGKLVMTANSLPKGELVTNDYASTAEYENISNILTFSAKTDGSGDLVIDIDNQNVDGSHGQRQYALLSGMIVTAGSSSSQPFAITEIDYAPDAEPNPTVTLSWNAQAGAIYTVYYSRDPGNLQEGESGDGDVEDSYEDNDAGGVDLDPEEGKITIEFANPDPTASDLFFSAHKNN